MNQLTGKKLLILGANPETAALVLTAREMGVYTIVTDYDPNAYAKRFADKSYDVDAINVEKIVALAEAENVDGVLVGVADALISTYQKVCERIGVPCYATEEQVKVFTNKNYFKRKCEEFGILGVPEYKLKDSEKEIRYPVIVKPTDSNSGKGISLCHNEEELPAAIQKALQASVSKTYLLEEYMECDDVSIYYTICNGKAYLSSLSDRYTCRDYGSLSPVCLGDVFPAKLLDSFLENEHPKFCKLFESLELDNAIFYTSAFYRDGKYYVYDPGFRLQGGGFHLILKGANGFDHRQMLINYALTGNMGVSGFEKKNDPFLNGKAAAVVWFLLKAGTITKIEGLNEVQKNSNVFHIVQRFQVGDIVADTDLGTERQVFLRLFLVCDNKEELKETVITLQQKVKVFDSNGNMMVIKGIDIEKILD